MTQDSRFTQFSLFGAAAAEPSLDDLDGVLLAGGQWARSGDGARLSVVVPDRWRADALATEFAARDLTDAEPIVRAAAGGWAVRTGFAPHLRAAAARWTRGANQTPPKDFALTPGGLRLWAITAGRRDESGHLMAVAGADALMHHSAGAALSRLGVAAVAITGRGGPGWRVTSLKRLRRLAELLGPAPDGGEPDWPLGGRLTFGALRRGDGADADG